MFNWLSNIPAWLGLEARENSNPWQSMFRGMFGGLANHFNLGQVSPQQQLMTSVMPLAIIITIIYLIRRK